MSSILLTVCTLNEQTENWAEIPLLDKKHILSISVQYVLTFGKLPTTAF